MVRRLFPVILLLSASLWATPSGTIKGTVRSTGPGNPGIPNALLRFPGPRSCCIDSVRTDASGKYEWVLFTGDYGVLVSAAGFKDSAGNPVKYLTAKIAQDSVTTLDVNLTPATCRIGGAVQQTNPPPYAPTPLPGARIRVIGPAGRADSAFTDTAGVYAFTNMLAGTYRFDFYSNGRTVGMNSVRTVAIGETLLVNMNFPSANTGILGAGNFSDRASFRFSNLNGELVLLLEASDRMRTLEVFTVDGNLRRALPIPPNASRMSLPEMYAPEKGYRLRLK